jgi:DNA replication protein DnaC
MLRTPTIDNLMRLKLGGMARALVEQGEQPNYQSLGFEERLGLLVDRELQDRDNRRLDRNLKAAKLRSQACIEDIDFHHPRGLDRSQVLQLASCQWVDTRQNVLIVGPTGAGKTYVACALAQAAVRQGHTALYLRAPRMLAELVTARADGRLPRLTAAWARAGVLVVDDFALQPLTSQQAGELLEVIEDRTQLRSTIVTSQVPVNMWHQAIGEPTVADAILDRLLHGAHRIELRGESMRRPDGDVQKGTRHSKRPPANDDPPAALAPGPKVGHGPAVPPQPPPQLEGGALMQH